MKFAKWWVYCVAISVGATTGCMEEVDPSGKKLVALLPKLTVLDPAYRSLGPFEASNQLGITQKRYQQAFMQSNTLDLLGAIAQPQTFVRQVIGQGNLIERTSSHTFPLANLAQGLLYLQQEKLVRAQLEFNLAQKRVGYKPHEHVVKEAASSALALTNNNHAEAFFHIKKLMHTPYNAVWQEFGLEQLRLLAQQGHALAQASVAAHDALLEKTKEDALLMLQLLLQPEYKNLSACPLLQRKKVVRHLRELSEEGNCAASNLMARLAFGRAVDSENILGKKITKLDTKITKQDALEQAKVYAQRACKLQEHSDYHTALLQFLDGAIAFEKQEVAQASKSLVTLMQQKSKNQEIVAVQQKALELLDTLAGKNDWRARCWYTAHHLQQDTQKQRRAGIQSAGQLLLYIFKNAAKVDESLLHEFKIIEMLHKTTDSNKPYACSVLAPWACVKAIEQQDVFGNNSTGLVAFEQAKAYIAGAQKKKKNKQFALLEQFVYGCLAFEQNEHSAAAELLCGVLNAKNVQELPKAVCSYITTQLQQLSDAGVVSAQAWRANQLLGQEDKDKRQQGVALCWDVIEKVLDDPGQEKYFAVTASQLCQKLEKVDTQPDARSQYLLSRYKFCQLHDCCEETGLSVDQQDSLKEVCRDMMLAAQSGHAGAQESAKAFLIYCGCLNLLKQKKYKDATKQLVLLHNCQGVPEVEKRLCSSFALYQLYKLAEEDVIPARCWCIKELLTSNDQEKVGKGLMWAHALLMQLAGTSLQEEDLKPVGTYKLVEAIEDCVDALENTELKAKGYCVLSKFYHVQSTIQQPFITTSDPSNNQLLLHTALEFAKEARRLSKDALSSQAYTRQVGHAFYLLANFYTRDSKRLLKYLRKGVELQDPGCMRALAIIHLKNPLHAMSKETLGVQIARLEYAYKHGDTKAADFLAQCYFDGPNFVLPCGYSLPKDRQKAYEIVSSSPSKAKETRRILSYMTFKKVIADNSCKDKQKQLDGPIFLMRDAAQAGDPEAFNYLAQMYGSGYLSQMQRMSIEFFLNGETKEKNCGAPALCAQGSIFLCKKKIKEAIECFQTAAQKDGVLGNSRLVLLYADNSFGRKDVCKAAEYCMKMIDGIRNAKNMHTDYTDLIVSVIIQVSDESEKNNKQATTLLKGLLAQSATIGIRVQSKVQSIEKLKEIATQVPLEQFVALLGDGSSAEAKKWLSNGAACQAIEYGAQQGDEKACFAMSNICLLQALRGKKMERAAKKKEIDKAKKYAEAAWEKNPCAEYGEHRVRATLQWLQYHQATYIPEMVLNAKAESDELVRTLKQLYEDAKEFGNDAAKIKKAAAHCIYQICLHGQHDNELSWFVDNHIFSNVDLELRDNAVHLISCYFENLCMKALSNTTWQMPKKGVCALIKQLADKEGHPEALHAVCQGLRFQACSGVPVFDSRTSDAEQQEVQNEAFEYSKKAKAADCGQANITWHALRLYQSKKMSKKDFAKSVKELGKAAKNHVPIAELMLNYYLLGTEKLPCGYTIKPDYNKAKKIALAMKDKSNGALEWLADDAGKRKKFQEEIEYRFKLAKRGGLPLISLAACCMNWRKYPLPIFNYLEQEVNANNPEAFHALGTLYIYRSRETVEQGTALFKKGWQEHDHPGCAISLALILSNAVFEQLDLPASWEYFSGGIAKMPVQEFNGPEVINGICTYLNNFVDCIARARQAENNAQEKEACTLLCKALALLKNYDCLNRSVDYLSTSALLYSKCLADYDSACEEIEKALNALGQERDPLEVNRIQLAAASVCEKALEVCKAKKMNNDTCERYLEKVKKMLAKHGFAISITLNKKGK